MGILDIDNHYKSMTLLENSTQRTITRREFFANIDSFCQLPTSGFEFSASTSFKLKSIGSTFPYAEIKNYVSERNPRLIQNSLGATQYSANQLLNPSYFKSYNPI
jgi:hypothetical protein